ncbi:MAG TPA: imidazolonepropionase, partial [Saprospiraceae bacterium]|nr:imidazolonepropionase [Saprospiraceae bacterium]
MSSLLLRNIHALVNIEPSARHRSVVAGAQMAQLPLLENAYLLMEGGLISRFGPMSECPDRADEVLDASGRLVLPGWCDSHTHLVFAATREEEFVDRIRGLTYEQIAERGGGILNSARKLQAMSEDALFEQAWERLQQVIGYGTG